MKNLVLTAERGDATAQFNLGVLYHNRLDDNGHAVKEGRAESIKWLRLAARQGLPRAQGKLAEVYTEEPNTPAKDVKACAWFLLAMEGLTGAHRQRAQSGYERISARLKPEQIVTARRLARVWRLKRPAAVTAAGSLVVP